MAAFLPNYVKVNFSCIIAIITQYPDLQKILLLLSVFQQSLLRGSKSSIRVIDRDILVCLLLAKFSKFWTLKNKGWPFQLLHLPSTFLFLYSLGMLSVCA